MRQKSKSGFDCLDMIYISRAMVECSRILDSHPTWVSSGSKVMSRLCLDYSKPSNWNNEMLMLADTNIPALWEKGRHFAESAFLGRDNCDFFEMMTIGVTLLKPFGDQKVGLTELSTDWSQIDVVETFTVMESDIQQSKSEEEPSESEEEKIEPSV